MKCPACGREMEPGYLQSDRPVVFTTRRPSLSGVAFPRIPRGQDLHLTNDAYSPCACPAWHCPSAAISWWSARRADPPWGKFSPGSAGRVENGRRHLAPSWNGV